MNTQEVLDPKSWAERTFGGVQLHDMRRTRRAVQAATSLAENPLGSLPAQMQTWKETKALYRLLDEPDVTKARVDAASRSTDQGTSHFRSRSAVGARYAVTSNCPIVARSAEWDKSATNEDGGYSCKRCLPCALRHERCWGAWPRNPLCAFPL